MQKQCLVCGNTFDKKSSESKKYFEVKKYCSRKCSLTETTVLKHGNFWKGKQMPKAMRLKISAACIGRKSNAGSFKKGIVPWTKGKKLAQFSGAKHPNWEPPIFLPCEYCGKTVERKPWQLKKHVYCNLVCSRAGIRGKNSPVYKGENAKNPLRQRIMQLPEYVAWRRAVFSRDTFKCVFCGKASGFEADHIVPYKDIRDRHSIRTTEDARSCAELWDISNGRTLCRECHRKTDNYPKNLLKNKPT
jgi:5-methylcytosine-specific restriction endonuclease McrA